MMATGVLASVIWFGSSWILLSTGLVNDTVGFFFGMGILFLPFALVTSFILGTLCWGTLYPDEDHELYGAIFGGMTALCSLSVGALGPALFVGVSNIASGEMAVSEALIFTIIILVSGVLFAIIAAGWLIVPVGVFGGWYHERAKTVDKSPEGSDQSGRK